MNQKFELSNKRANEGTSNALAELANKANENQAQYGEIYEQSKQIKELSDGSAKIGRASCRERV